MIGNRPGMLLLVVVSVLVLRYALLKFNFWRVEYMFRYGFVRTYLLESVYFETFVNNDVNFLFKFFIDVILLIFCRQIC